MAPKVDSEAGRLEHPEAAESAAAVVASRRRIEAIGGVRMVKLSVIRVNTSGRGSEKDAELSKGAPRLQ